MTLQLLHSEFPYIWGKFDFLFYQCGRCGECARRLRWRLACMETLSIQEMMNILFSSPSRWVDGSRPRCWPTALPVWSSPSCSSTCFCRSAGHLADFVGAAGAWWYYTDKKENQIFLIYKEIQSGAVAKLYMRKGFLICEEMHKYFTIYERRPLAIYVFATARFWISLYMRKIWFAFYYFRSLAARADKLWGAIDKQQWKWKWLRTNLWLRLQLSRRRSL